MNAQPTLLFFFFYYHFEKGYDAGVHSVQFVEPM